MEIYVVQSGKWRATALAESPRKALEVAVLRDQPDELGRVCSVHSDKPRKRWWFATSAIFQTEEED